MNKSVESNDAVLQETAPQTKDWVPLCIQLRDKHLGQLMETSGKAVVAVISVAVVAIYSSNKGQPSSLDTWVAIASAALFGLSVIFLLKAGHQLAVFHLNSIRELERKAAENLKPCGPDFQIVPIAEPGKWNAMDLTLIGITLLVVSAAMMVITAAM